MVQQYNNTDTATARRIPLFLAVSQVVSTYLYK